MVYSRRKKESYLATGVVDINLSLVSPVATQERRGGGGDQLNGIHSFKNVLCMQIATANVSRMSCSKQQLRISSVMVSSSSTGGL